ncbi:MAG TPA: tetratricopeptide repeat protein [Polyangiaceae bacterium]|nr:tetratricopeptide repeat protein [Polyangiaceae bacterium]
MSRSRAAALESVTPELMLRKATLARTAGMRAKYAARGLSHDGTVDETTRAMLLRQLYLSQMEGRRFADALDVAEQMLTLAVMPDVARQDAARACLGLGDRPRAIEHLRLASRVSPPSRRAFHLWTLGSVLYLAGNHREAIGALMRASRWGTTDKPLYQAQVALARLANGESPGEDMGVLRERLADAPCGQGYGQFVLGELAYNTGDFSAAREYLRAFVKRSTTGRVALAVALEGEVGRARRLLTRIRQRSRNSR